MESKSQQSILKIRKKFPSNSEFQTKKIDKKLIEQRSSKSCNKFRNALYHLTTQNLREFIFLRSNFILETSLLD